MKEISFHDCSLFIDDEESPNAVSLLECLDSATQLTSLDLTDECLEDYRPDDKLTGGRYNSMLNNLFMTDRSYKTLIKLDLSNNKLQSLISIVQTLLKIPWLKDLNLSKNLIDDASIDYLLQWIVDEQPPQQKLQMQNIKLEKLNLYNCYIEIFDTVTRFLEDSHISSIKKLDLRENCFDNEDFWQRHADVAFRDKGIEILIEN